MLMVWLYYVLIGGVAGILAGMLGVGGGTIIVPALIVIFTSLGFAPASIQHLALGTSLATILFTSISSFRAHHKRGAVDWGTVRRISPGIVVGTLGGTWVAALISTALLQWIFAAFLIYVVYQLLGSRPPHATRSLPGLTGMTAMGGLIGIVSSLVGIGGGSLMLPFFVWCNMAVRTAIGTSAAVGFFIAAAGTAGYMFSGSGVPLRPDYSIGFVYLPATVGIAVASMLTAPLGAWLSHRMPVPTLKKCFAVLLLCVDARLLGRLIGQAFGL